MLIGIHTSARRDLTAAIKAAANYGIKINSAQVFVSGPMNSEINENNLKMVDATRSITFYAHASYLDHLLGKRPHFTAINLQREIAACIKHHIKGITVHMPRVGTAAEIAAAVSKIKDIRNVGLMLETEPVPHHTDPMFLASVVNACGSGLTLDTAHLFSGGFPVHDSAQSAEFLAAIDSLMPNTSMMLHLNDQKWTQGSGSDEHMTLTTGKIWHGRPKSIGVWVNWAISRGAPIILEHGNDELNYATLRKYFS